MGDVMSKMPVFLNGELRDYQQSMKAELNSGMQKVVTTAQGLVGFSSGAPEVTIDLTEVIQNSGIQAEVWNWCANEEWVDLQIGVGAGDFVSSGKILTVSLSTSTDKPADLTYQWVGKPGQLE
jgi:hypothetical protein